MLLLAIDTSGKYGSIALARGAPDGSCSALEVVPLEGGTFSSLLVPQIAALLAKHGFGKQDIGGLVAASGPGSFTGLRVGLAAVKALAEVLRKPIAAVSLLEVVATAGNTKGRAIAALDAGRNEVYAAEFEGGVPQKERLLTQEEFLQAARGRAVITPDAGIANLARGTASQVQEIDRPRSDAVARIGWRRILSRDTISAEALEANYIRRSDAEIFSKPDR